MLSPRLKAIYNNINRCEVLADIGCDHGFIPIEAVKGGIAHRAVACDISKPSLLKAEKNIRLAGLSKKIDTRCGGGLEPLSKGEADTVIIAGMGGILIADILKSGFSKIGSAKLILQPMSNIPELRERLVNGGFSITGESLVREERRIYTVISAEIGKTEDYDFEVGTALIDNKDPLLKEWLIERIECENEILSKIPRGSDDFIKHSRLKEKYKEVSDRI